MDPKCSVSGALHSLTLEMPAGVWPSEKPGAREGRGGKALFGVGKSSLALFASSRGEWWGAWGWLRRSGEGISAHCKVDWS